MAQNIPIYIPTYIGDQNYGPARVLPRLLFYNGTVECQTYYLQGTTGSQAVGFPTTAVEVNSFPYFDNYSAETGSFPTTGSKSLLFYNEESLYGQTPTASLYSEYWDEYVQLLYNPRTRLLNATAIIPLADYFDMELNDVVSFRGEYWHLRYINDYNLKNGECVIQLLGPIYPQSLPFSLPPDTPSTTTSTTSTSTTSTSTTSTSTTSTSTTSTSTSTSTTTTTTACPDCGAYSISKTNISSPSGTVTYMDCNGCIKTFDVQSQQERYFNALTSYNITWTGGLSLTSYGAASYKATLGDFNLDNGCAPITDLCQTQEVTIGDPGYGIFYVSYVDPTDCTCKQSQLEGVVTYNIISGSLSTSAQIVSVGAINPTGSICCLPDCNYNTLVVDCNTTTTSTTTTTLAPCLPCNSYTLRCTLTNGCLGGSYTDCNGALTAIPYTPFNLTSTICVLNGQITPTGYIIIGGQPNCGYNPTGCNTSTTTTTTAAPTTTTTTTSPPGYTAFFGCGEGNNVSAACNDASINNRTFWSDCDSSTLGAGCIVYSGISPVPTVVTGVTNVFMNGVSWDINSSTGVILNASSVQC